MAISNLVYPTGKPTCQDSLWHIFNTDITGYADYKYVMDIFIGGVQKTRVKIYPEPHDGKGYFDAGPVVRNSMTYDWFDPTDNVLSCEPSVTGEIAQTYQYRIGEEYDGTTYLNLVNGNVTAYNFSTPLLMRGVSDLSSYNGRSLSNRSNTIKYSIGENLFIGAMGIDKITVKTYGSSNQLITSVDYSLGGLKSFAELNIGSPALNKSTVIINDAVKYYTVQVGTTTYKVVLDCNPKYESYNLHFLNALGMFDTAKFGLVSRLTMNVERKDYTKKDYNFGASNVEYKDSNNKYNAGKINYLNKRDYTWKLTMDAPNDTDYEWLQELIYSPQVYMEIDGYYYPVSINLDTYEISKYVNNRLRVLELEVKMNTKRFSQLR